MLTKKEQHFEHELKRIAEVRFPNAFIQVENHGGIVDVVCYYKNNWRQQSYTGHSFENCKDDEIFTTASICIRNFIQEEYVTVLPKNYSNSIEVKQSNKTLLLCTMIILP